ncbi:hypothetical protein DEQ92_18680 [Haloferax sp. Atlit-6N]|uniref:hypothetical protein n=1 Tax=Haloferax sp. Atlit-6N TaxID=2077205 RepID=UPI000E222A7F|nr:hypothetical protein [Haloferax sp. Atlit-6N]REA01369.1 hypothetical protein DEQ92_18680 [Haloferax sp. Atlit-6N]
MASYSAVALLAVFFVGLVVGAGVVVYSLPTETTTSPTSSMTTATGCLLADETAPSSWVGRMPAGEQTTVAFNRTFTHDAPSVVVRGELDTAEDGVYVYRITTAPDEDGEKEPSDDCVPRTTLDAVVSVPSDFDSVTVTFDGEEMVRFEAGDSSPLFRTLEE